MSGRRLALVVATDRYDDPTLHGLAAPAADAEALADVLGDADLGGFEIDILRNPTSWETAQHVETLLSERRPADLVLLHFSCHGLKDESGELFLAARNTSPIRLASTAVDTALVNRLMQRSRAQRVVLLLDCCYGGAFERGVVARADPSVHVGDQFSQGQLVSGRGRVVITASSAMEYALEGTDLTAGGSPQPSLFTGALVNGLSSGEADRDQDGQVGLDELYEYVFEKVRQRSPNQTPSKWEFGLQGDLVIARNPRRQIRPAPVPEDISELVQHPTAGVRLGAVDELARMAAQDDLQRAAGAVLLLRRLLDDDSRRVSQAAAGELDRIAPTASSSSIDFGHIPVGTTSVADVQILGSPLALASTVETSRTELQARLQGSVLHVEATGATQGPLEGRVTLSGPAGEQRINVTATVSADPQPTRRSTRRVTPNETHGGTEPARRASPTAQNRETIDPPRVLGEVAQGNQSQVPSAEETAAHGTHPDSPWPGSERTRVGHRRWYVVPALLVLTSAGALIAWLSLVDGNQATDQAPPQPFSSTVLHDFARHHFDADDCFIPDETQAPVAFYLPHTELVRCESAQDPYTGTFMCSKTAQELESNREEFFDTAVDGTLEDIEGPGAGMNAATDGVQVSYHRLGSNNARVYWDSPSMLCSGEIQALDDDVTAAIQFWRDGKST